MQGCAAYRLFGWDRATAKMINKARLVRLSTLITLAFTIIVYMTKTCSGFALIHTILASFNGLYDCVLIVQFPDAGGVFVRFALIRPK